MDTSDRTSDLPAPARSGRAGRRARALLIVAVAMTLAWTGVSYLATADEATAPVTVLPGAAANGAVAAVRGLTGSVTNSKGGSVKQIGVKFARIEVAEAYQTSIRITMAWQNPSEFAKSTGSSSWQLRFGLYYPVHTGTCTSGETTTATGAVTVTLLPTESYTGGSTTQQFCAYRDVQAIGPGAVTTVGDEDRGTQLLSTAWQVGTLQPQKADGEAPPSLCTETGSVPCLPADLPANQRAFFVVASLLNPGGNVPSGQVDALLGVRMYFKATKVGG